MESDDQSVSVTGCAVSDVSPHRPPPPICAYLMFSSSANVAPSLSVFIHRAVRMVLHQSFMTEEQFKYSGAFQHLTRILLVAVCHDGDQ